MRKDVGVDGDAQRISQLVWMFFLKIFDDREDELELIEDDYHSPPAGRVTLAQLGQIPGRDNPPRGIAPERDSLA